MSTNRTSLYLRPPSSALVHGLPHHQEINHCTWYSVVLNTEKCISTQAPTPKKLLGFFSILFDIGLLASSPQKTVSFLWSAWFALSYVTRVRNQITFPSQPMTTWYRSLLLCNQHTGGIKVVNQIHVHPQQIWAFLYSWAFTAIGIVFSQWRLCIIKHKTFNLLRVLLINGINKIGLKVTLNARGQELRLTRFD